MSSSSLATARRIDRRAIRALALCFLLVASVYVALPFLPTSSGGAEGVNPPKGIRLSYLDDPTTAVITWYTRDPTTSRAEWGLSPGLPFSDAVVGTDYTTPSGNTSLHTVTLTGLTPGALYYYRVGNADMSSQFQEVSFRAAPAKGSQDTFTFAAAADWGDTRATRNTSTAIGAKNVNLALPDGDLYYSDSEIVIQNVTRQFQRFGTSAFVMPATGTNEHPFNGADTPTEIVCAFVNLPGNERTYAYTYGNTFFLTVDWGVGTSNQTDGVDGSGPSCGGVEGTAAIRAWMDAQLIAADLDSRIQWKVVYQHQFCYGVSNTWQNNVALCPNGLGLPDQMEDLLVKHHVDLVIQGHDHKYGRTYPVKFGAPVQTGSTYNDPGAPVYVLVGTGGSPNTGLCRTFDWIAKCEAPNKTAGFGWFSVSPSSIEYKFYRNNATNPDDVIDSFTLSKPVPTDFNVTLDPTSGAMGKGEVLASTVTVRGVSSTPVSLSLHGCPKDTTCTLTPDSGSVGFRSQLQIATSEATPSGTYPLAITASNGTLTKAVAFDLAVSDRANLSFSRGDGGSFSETDDTWIGNEAPGTNHGGDPPLNVDGECGDPGYVCKALIKFPLIIGSAEGQIPAGATIVNASLALTVTDPGDPEGVYQVTEAWTEPIATWDGFLTPGFPANRGLEFTIAPSANGTLLIDLTAIVQRWADGDVNQGILLASETPGGAKYNSSDAPSDRPTLWVEFLTPPPPPSMDFALSVEPSSGLVALGGGLNATVTAEHLSGPANPVLYSCADLPAGASCTFAPSTSTPTSAVNLSLVTSASTPDGVHVVSVRVTDGLVTRNAAFSMTVTSLALSFDLETLTAGGAMQDLSGFGRNGTLYGTADVAGHDGRARSFNGTEKITAPAISVPGLNLTVAAWFNWTTNPSPYYSGIKGGGYSWELWVRADGRFAIVFYQTISPDLYTAAVSPLAYNDGMWHHAAGVLRSGLAELYVDGVLVARDTTDPITSVRLSTQTVVGHVASDFVGAIDEVRIFIRALTAEEIAALAPPPPPNADDLVLSYDMETLLLNGQMKDLSGQGNHGILTGTADVPGQVGRARSFDGSDKITAPAISVSALNFTVAAWFNWTTNPSPYYSGIQGGGGSWELRVLTDGRFVVVFYQAISPDVYTAAVSPLAYNDGTWHHAAGVLRSGLAELYVDGVLVARDTTNPIAAVRPSTSTVVGRIASDFVGAIDEVRIFTRALSAEEIAVLAPPPTPVNGFVLFYDMETLLLNGQMKDLSGQGNHGILTGTTDVAGLTDRARSFNGADKITAPAISVPGLNLTVAAWFNWTSNPSPYYSGIQGGGSSWELRVQADGRFLVVFYQAVAPDLYTAAVSPLAYNDGTWHHGAGVLRSGFAELYVDGVLVAQDTTNPIASVRTSTSTVVGRVASGFVGAIDEVRVFSRALGAAEIAALAPPPPPNADGLVLSYDMETLLLNGQMKDLSGQGNHGTLTGTTDVPGQAGLARFFSGSDKITAPAIPVPGVDFTVAAWFNWTTNPSPYYSGIQGGGSSWELHVQADGRFLVVFYQAVTPDVYTAAVSALAYNDGAWHHAAGVLRNGLAELYVDGVLVAQDTTNPIASVRTSTSTVVGRVASGFVGAIDEVRIFTRALSLEEVAALAPGSTLAGQLSRMNVYAESLPGFSQLPSCPVSSVGLVSTCAASVPYWTYSLAAAESYRLTES